MLELPFSIKILNPDAPIDGKYFNEVGMPYDSTAQMLSQTAGIRHRGLTMILNTGEEYWFKDGIADIDLVAKDTAVVGVYLPLAGGTLTGDLILNANPTIGLGAATKNYVDSAIAATAWKNAVDVATTGDITLSGEQTIDDILTSTSDVLVWQQSDPTENGIYTTAAGAWTRRNDANIGAEIVGSAVPVSGGTLYNNTRFIYIGASSITIGVDDINYTIFDAGSVYTAGTGLDLTGNIFSINVNGVTNSLFRQSSGLSVVGRASNSTGDIADITAASDYQVFRRSGTSIGFGSVDLSQSNAVGSSILAYANGGTGLSTLGTSLQYLRTNAGATALEWATLPTPFALTNGNGTTANGTAVDLGGTLTGNVNIDGEYGVIFGDFTPITNFGVTYTGFAAFTTTDGNFGVSVTNSEDSSVFAIEVSTNNSRFYYFNGGVSDDETYESRVDVTSAGIITKWSGDTGASGSAVEISVGNGLDGESAIDGFHVYTTTSNFSAVDADLRFRIETDGTATWNLGSDATGDIYQRNGSGNFSRLAAVSAGSFLRSGGVGTVSAWSTVKLPNTISAGSIWAANAANTIIEVTPSAGQSIRWNAGGTAWEAYTPGSGGGFVTETITANVTIDGNYNVNFGTSGSRLAYSQIYTTGAILLNSSGSISINGSTSTTLESPIIELTDVPVTASSGSDHILIRNVTTGNIEKLGIGSGLSISGGNLVAAGGGGGISNTAAANELAKSDGTDIGPSGIFSTTSGNLDFGSVALSGNRTLSVLSSDTNASFTIQAQGTGASILRGGTLEWFNNSSQRMLFLAATSLQLGIANFTVKASNISGGAGPTLTLQAGSNLSGSNVGGDVVLLPGTSDTGLDGNAFVSHSSGNLIPLDKNGHETESADFTVDESHRGKIVYCTKAGTQVITIPSGFIEGWNTVFVAWGATTVISLSASGTTLVGKTATTVQYETLALDHSITSETYLGI